MVEAGRFHVHSVTFTFRHGRWWASVQAVAAEFHHLQRSPATRSQTPVGVDLGVKTLAVVAGCEGNTVEEVQGPRSLAAAQDRMRTLNRRLARTTPGSRQHATVTRQLNTLHLRAAAIRRHEAHEFTTRLVSNHQSITVEDLHVAGMTRLRTLGRAVADAGMGNLLSTLAYKADWYGVDLHIADRWYPSSKTCSGCGNVKDTLLLSERVYRCEACGMALDRDVNAARQPGPLACHLRGAAADTSGRLTREKGLHREVLGKSRPSPTPPTEVGTGLWVGTPTTKVTAWRSEAGADSNRRQRNCRRRETGESK